MQIHTDIKFSKAWQSASSETPEVKILPAIESREMPSEYYGFGDGPF